MTNATTNSILQAEKTSFVVALLGGATAQSHGTVGLTDLMGRIDSLVANVSADLPESIQNNGDFAAVTRFYAIEKSTFEQSFVATEVEHVTVVKSSESDEPSVGISEQGVQNEDVTPRFQDAGILVEKLSNLQLKIQNVNTENSSVFLEASADGFSLSDVIGQAFTQAQSSQLEIDEAFQDRNQAELFNGALDSAAQPIATIKTAQFSTSLMNQSDELLVFYLG